MPPTLVAGSVARYVVAGSPQPGRPYPAGPTASRLASCPSCVTPAQRRTPYACPSGLLPSLTPSRTAQCQLNIDAKTVEHLKAWKKRQREEFALLCKEQKRETPVCCSDKGDYIAPTNFSRWWRTLAEESGFAGLRFHELRHTQATQLVSNGVDMKTVQHHLGHSSATFTMNLYAHALPENDEQAALLIVNLLSQPPAGKLVEKDPLRMAV